MSVIHHITHPTRLTERKVNYFADYYSFVVYQMGKNSDFEIDNILSVTEKIIFQLENNLELSLPYIKSHLSSPLIQSENKYFKEFRYYSSVSVLFDNYRKLDNDKKRKQWLKVNSLFLLAELKKFKTYLKRHMFKNALNAVVSFLKCSHDIEEHRVDLHHYTYLIAVELFYKYKGKADIKSVFDRIMSRDESEFPFCPKFLKKNEKNLTQAKKDFIANRTFDEQFLGIKNFLNQKTAKHNYIFRIGNILCDDDFKYVEGDVTFCCVSNSKIQQAKSKVNSNSKKIKLNFFEDHFQLFAIVSQKAIENDFTQAIEVASFGLQNINKVSNTSGVLDKYSYLVTTDFKTFGGSISFSGSARKLTRTSVATLASLNAYGYLNNKRIKSKVDFLKHEGTYLKAKNNNEIDLYWKYVENLMGKGLKIDFSKIISKTLVDLEIDLSESYIQNCLSPFNTDSKSLGITIEEQQELLRSIETNNDFDYSKLTSLIKNDFIVEVVNYWGQLRQKDNADYILRLINELYEQRNFILHAGKKHEKSILKLNETIPWLFSIYRRCVIKGMIDNPNKNFREVAKILVEQA